MSELGKGFGLVIGLAIVAVIAAKPGFIAPTFTGASNLIGAAVSPVTKGK